MISFLDIGCDWLNKPQPPAAPLKNWRGFETGDLRVLGYAGAVNFFDLCRRRHLWVVKFADGRLDFRSSEQLEALAGSQS